MTQAKPLCGFLNVLKPPGMSSAQVVGCVRRLLGGVKAGHAGTLDPEAAGVLPVMVGKAARLFDYLQDKEKEYVAEVAFGWPPIRRMRRAYPLPMETAGRMKPRSPLLSRVSKEKSCRRRPCTAP